MERGARIHQEKRDPTTLYLEISLDSSITFKEQILHFIQAQKKQEGSLKESSIYTLIHVSSPQNKDTSELYLEIQSQFQAFFTLIQSYLKLCKTEETLSQLKSHSIGVCLHTSPLNQNQSTLGSTLTQGGLQGWIKSLSQEESKLEWYLCEDFGSLDQKTNQQTAFSFFHHHALVQIGLSLKKQKKSSSKALSYRRKQINPSTEQWEYEAYDDASLSSEQSRSEGATHSWESISDLLVTGGGRGITALCLQTLPLQNKTLWICGRTPRLVPPSQRSQQETLYLQAIQSASTPQDEVRNLLHAHAQLDLPSLPLPHIKKLHTRLTAQIELDQRLSYFESLGARVEYLSVDVAHPTSITKAIQARDPNALSRIQGVIHGAGILNDQYFIKKEWEPFQQVLQVKTALFSWIEQTLPNLTFLVGFSSVSAALGNQGQTDYACANAMMDAYIEWKSQMKSELYGVSMQWGPWSGAGMVSESLEAYYQKAGIQLIPAHEGQRCFKEDTLLLNPRQSGIFLRSFPFVR